nr:MAG: putative RNA dependent RNA polymerase [Lestijarvi totivirus]
MKQEKEKTIELDNGSNTLITVPKWVSKPHVCTLSGLQLAEVYYKMNWLSSKLYDEWTALNGHDYQLGNSPACMRLWSDFSNYAKSLWKVKVVVSDVKEAVLAKQAEGIIRIRKCHQRKNGRHVKVNWERIKCREDLLELDAIWEYSSSADAQKTTISASQIVWHAMESADFRKNFDDMINVLGVTASNVTATAIAFHCLGNPSVGNMIKLVHKNRICCLNPFEYAECFKLLSVALRRSSYWPDGTKAALEDVAHCAGWELAIGRSANVSDWATEEAKRTNQVMNLKLPHIENVSSISNMDYCKVLESVLTRLLGPLIFNSQFTQSYEDFIRNRQSWVSSGSSGGERITVEGENIRINKHVYFEKLTKEEMISWLDDEPITEATASEKFESGKSRAIYGTKVKDYAISAYILNDIEVKLSSLEGIESGLIGLDVLASVERRTRIARKPSTECSMIDYADFNYQHTLLAQSLVFRVLSKLFRINGSHPDKVRACDWIEKALLNQWCRFPLSNKIVKIVQGMFSGCRGTNFINTVLNKAYFDLAKDWVFEHLNILPVELFSIHQGDDVWITNESRVWAIVLFKCMQASGFDFQAKKQMFDKCRAEFLRVLYSSEGCMGYLSRAIPTLIVKPIQSTDISGPVERAIAMNSQVNLLFRRGFSFEGCVIAWKALVPYEARVTFPKGSFSIPFGVLRIHPRNGGLGLAPPMHLTRSKGLIKPPPTIQVSSVTLEQIVPMNMSKDWISYISDKIGCCFDSEALMKMVHASNVTDSLRPKDRLACLEELEEVLRQWKSKLVIPEFSCTVQNLKDQLDMGGFNQSISFLLNDLLAGVLPKHVKEDRGLISVIHLAINLCPFKNLSAASVSLKGEWVDIVRTCLGMCSKPAIQYKACMAFNLCLSNVGVPVTKLLMEGMNLGSSYYECYWHPVILSWITGKAVDTAEMRIIGDGVSNVEVARRIMFEEYVKAINVLYKYKEMRDMSRY